MKAEPLPLETVMRHVDAHAAAARSAVAHVASTAPPQLRAELAVRHERIVADGLRRRGAAIADNAAQLRDQLAPIAVRR